MYNQAQSAKPSACHKTPSKVIHTRVIIRACMHRAHKSWLVKWPTKSTIGRTFWKIARPSEHMHFLRPNGCHIHVALLEGSTTWLWWQVVQPTKVTVVSIYCQLGAMTQTLESYHPLHLCGLFWVWLRWACRHVLQTLLWLIYVPQLC